MKKQILSAIALMSLVLLNGCAMYEDWKANMDEATIGGGAVAGKDYINGLQPSAASRQYFSRMQTDSAPVTVRRSDAASSSTGVRFVKDGGIVIPPGVTIQYTNKGYCMDPNLPAPVANEEYQLVKTSLLIPNDLRGVYNKLMTKVANGDPNVQANIQHLVWALRTAGSKAAYANNLTDNQKRILDSCSDYSGQFMDFNTSYQQGGGLKGLLGSLFKAYDNITTINIGGVSYDPADLLDPDVGSKKISAHMEQLMQLGKSMPIERVGLNYGELRPGIYADVKGSGYLQFSARIANSTDRPFTYYPQEYVGQVGSGVSNKSSSLTFFAAVGSSMRQRTTQTVPEKVKVEDRRAPEKKAEDEYEYVCKTGCTDGCQRAYEKKRKSLNAYLGLRADWYCLTHGVKLGWDLFSEPFFSRLGNGKSKAGKYARHKLNIDLRKTVDRNALKGVESSLGIVSATEIALTAGNEEAYRGEAALRTAMGYAGVAGVPGMGYYDAGRGIGETVADLQTGEFDRKLNAYLDEIARKEWADFWKNHTKVKKNKQ